MEEGNFSSQIFDEDIFVELRKAPKKDEFPQIKVLPRPSSSPSSRYILGGHR